MTAFEPAYRQLARRGELRRRVEQAYTRLTACDLCAWNCRVDRRTAKGVCRTGTLAVVSIYGAHHGEENPLRGTLGSGMIFFAGCNLKCQFCQNYEISQLSVGHEAQPEEIAAMMLDLQESGCRVQCRLPREVWRTIT